MDYISIGFILVAAIFWKLFISKYRISLSSPVFRNTETKELGCWASRTLRLPFSPFPGLTIHDGRGTVCTVREVSWDKDDPDIITCHTYYDQPICVDIEQYEHIKKCMKDSGWKLREVSAGHILNWWKEEFEK